MPSSKVASLPNISKREHLLQILSNTPFEGILVVDIKGTVVFVNDFFLELLHRHRQEVLGCQVIHILPDCHLMDTLVRGYSEWGDRLLINGKELYTARFPLKDEGELLGAMLKSVFPDMMVGRSVAESMLRQHGESQRVYPSRQLFTCMNIVGQSESMLSVKKLARRASKTSSTLLITGESGTGKEIIAQAIHTRSVRRDAPFISVNCGAIPRELMESELFGYVGGAFTGAKRDGNLGKFELANGGTILLDEIGEMPLDMQVKLLRIIQEKEVWRVGGSSPIKLDVRIMASTNRDLQQMILEGTFRQDLYYRINILSIHMPPLRERVEDLPALISSLLCRINQRLGTHAVGITPESMEIAKSYGWPGNVRELENALEQSVNWSNDEIIDFLRIPNRFWEGSKSYTSHIPLSSRNHYQLDLQNRDCELLVQALRTTAGNRSAAAKILGISRSAFYRKLEKYELI